MYSHILFDADNTLLDFSKAERNAFILTMDAHSLPWDEAMLSRYVEINIRLRQELERGLIDKKTVQLRRFEILFGDRAVPSADINRTFQQHLAAQSELMPGAGEVSEALSQRAELSIVTNGVGTTQRQKMNRSGLLPYFSRLFISEDLGFPKPDLRFFEHVMSELGHPDPASVLIVGDSLTSDIQGGMNAGVATCWFNLHSKPIPTGYRIDHVIEDLYGLLDIVPCPARVDEADM